VKSRLNLIAQALAFRGVRVAAMLLLVHIASTPALYWSALCILPFLWYNVRRCGTLPVHCAG
jgi:hypothetical protein